MLGVFVTAAVTIFALIDLMRIDEARVRALPRPLWVATIVLLPLIGAILWFTLGRDRGDGRRPARGVVAPDDDPAFLGRIGKEREQEERIRRLEQELAELEDDDTRED